MDELNKQANNAHVPSKIKKEAESPAPLQLTFNDFEQREKAHSPVNAHTNLRRALPQLHHATQYGGVMKFGAI